MACVVAFTFIIAVIALHVWAAYLGNKGGRNERQEGP